MNKGIPALAGYKGVTDTESTGKKSYCRVGSFPKPGQLIGRLLKPCGRSGCSLRARLRCAECGFFSPGETLDAQKVGVSPGRDGSSVTNWGKAGLGWRPARPTTAY